ncbi:MAG TPA: hypothetical protein VFU89_06655 [Rhabdochlamydiaceae bacterium]|nr:hypothetical protein [Rhabdochlamydiaceae bacterium]
MSQLTAVRFKSDSISTLYHVMKNPYFYVAGLVIFLAGLAFLQLRKLSAGGSVDNFRDKLWEISSINSPIQSFKVINFSGNGQYVIYSSMAALKHICQTTEEGVITDGTQNEHRQAQAFLYEKIRESGATVFVHVLDMLNFYRNYAGNEDIHSQFPAMKYYEMPIFHEIPNFDKVKDQVIHQAKLVAQELKEGKIVFIHGILATAGVAEAIAVIEFIRRREGFKQHTDQQLATDMRAILEEVAATGHSRLPNNPNMLLKITFLKELVKIS